MSVGTGLQGAIHHGGRPGGRFSCVVDEHPRFHLEVLRWFACLTQIAGVDPGDLTVHAVGSTSTESLDYLLRCGVSVRSVAAFDRRSPHCNKISGALRLADAGVDGVAVLCDTDIVVLEDPRLLDLPDGAVAAKPVDAPVPPPEVLAEIFEAANLPAPDRVPLPWGPDQWTLAGNSNGGLYLVPGTLLRPVAEAWAEQARWLLERAELLREWTVHVDQVAMAMALVSTTTTVHRLDVRWNTPTHDLTRVPADPPVPAIIHYHQEVDRDGRIRRIGSPAIDGQIERANIAINRVWSEAAPDTTHRHWLDLTGTSTPALVVADPADDRVLAVLIDGLDQPSVLRLTDGAEPATRSAADAERADVVVAQLRAEGTDDDCRQNIETWWERADRALMVKGATGRGPDLSARLAVGLAEAELYPIGESSIIALRPPPDRHPRDYPSGTLAPLIGRHPDPLRLLAIRLHAWQTLGFYPDHAPRLWEYPVVAGLVAEGLDPGSRLVDVGAGVTPLAPYLTDQGYVVETVDPSEIRRTWPPAPGWNEWDFLDYAEAGLAHRSWNCPLDQLPVEPQFDGAYSISVIEHMRADDRRSLIADIAVRVRSGGLVVLTVDLVRGRDTLWNRSRGLPVEPGSVHGDFDTIAEECSAAGLDLFRRETVRDWGTTEVDIGLLALRRTDAPVPRGARQPGRRAGWRKRIGFG